jgi:hypothetical protein
MATSDLFVDGSRSELSRVTLKTDLQRIEAFLPCRTPDAWIEAALGSREGMVIADRSCELREESGINGLWFDAPLWQSYLASQ